MKPLEISTLKALYDEIHPFQTDIREFTQKWRDEFKVKFIDRLYKILNEQKEPSLAQYEFLCIWIPKYWIIHFGENNFENKVSQIRAGLKTINQEC